MIYVQVDRHSGPDVDNTKQRRNVFALDTLKHREREREKDNDI